MFLFCSDTAVRWGDVDLGGGGAPEVAAAPPPHLLVPLHSIYFAVATLAFSVLIVVVTVSF